MGVGRGGDGIEGAHLVSVIGCCSTACRRGHKKGCAQRQCGEGGPREEISVVLLTKPHGGEARRPRHSGGARGPGRLSFFARPDSGAQCCPGLPPVGGTGPGRRSLPASRSAALDVSLAAVPSESPSVSMRPLVWSNGLAADRSTVAFDRGVASWESPSPGKHAACGARGRNGRSRHGRRRRRSRRRVPGPGRVFAARCRRNACAGRGSDSDPGDDFAGDAGFAAVSRESRAPRQRPANRRVSPPLTVPRQAPVA